MIEKYVDYYTMWNFTYFCKTYTYKNAHNGYYMHESIKYPEQSIHNML